MAQVTITIEDRPEGGVKVACTPSFETMMMMNESGTGLTSGQAYAIYALNRLREESQRQAPTPILIPRLGR